MLKSVRVLTPQRRIHAYVSCTFASPASQGARVYQAALLAGQETTIQVSRRATNDGIINTTLLEPRTQPRIRIALLQRESDASRRCDSRAVFSSVTMQLGGWGH